MVVRENSELTANSTQCDRHFVSGLAEWFFLASTLNWVLNKSPIYIKTNKKWHNSRLSLSYTYTRIVESHVRAESFYDDRGLRASTYGRICEPQPVDHAWRHTTMYRWATQQGTVELSSFHWRLWAGVPGDPAIPTTWAGLALILHLSGPWQRLISHVVSLLK